MLKIQPHTLFGERVLIRDTIGFSSLLSLLHALLQICHLASIVGCFVHSAMAWAVPKQCCGAIEKIIGFSLKQFYADAIEPVHGVKVRAILGPIQMRTGQYTLRQMSKPISSFSLTGGSVCVAQRFVHSAERVRSSFMWNKWKSQWGVEYVAAAHLRTFSSH